MKACNNDVDEVWVPSEFVRHAFLTSGVQPAKVHLIAEAIDVFAFDPAVATPITLPLRGRHTQHWTYWSSRPYHPEQETYYKFLSNFKWEMRKGWEILFESYFTEFAATYRVSLYVTVRDPTFGSLGLWRRTATRTTARTSERLCRRLPSA